MATFALRYSTAGSRLRDGDALRIPTLRAAMDGQASHARARLTNLVVVYPLIAGATATLPDAGPHAGEAAVLTP